jgi:hypothetical protein
MRPALPRVSLVGVALLLSCSDGPGAPSSSLSPAPARHAAVTTHGTSSFTFEGTDFLACLNETVHLHGIAPLTFQSTVTPSGNVIYADHFIAGAATGTAESVTSANRWVLTRLVSPEVIRVAAGEGAFFTTNATWKSTTGAPTFTVHQNFHVVQNATGAITVDRFDNVCNAI